MADPSSFYWSPEEEGAASAVPPDLTPDMDFDPPTITLAQGDGPSIIATWVPSPALNRSYEVHYRDDLDGPYVPMVVSDFRDSARSGTVAPGIYHVRIRVSAGPQAVGPWSWDHTIEIEGDDPEEQEE